LRRIAPTGCFRFEERLDDPGTFPKSQQQPAKLQEIHQF
jgi:hypothetical protein